MPDYIIAFDADPDLVGERVTLTEVQAKVRVREGRLRPVTDTDSTTDGADATAARAADPAVVAPAATDSPTVPGTTHTSTSTSSGSAADSGTGQADLASAVDQAGKPATTGSPGGDARRARGR